jgi:hypothetical protein
MKIQLVRGIEEIAKEIEFVNVFPPDEVRRLALEALFGYFDTDGTHCWPKLGQELLVNASPHEARIINEVGQIVHTYDLRDMANDLRLVIVRQKPSESN